MTLSRLRWTTSCSPRRRSRRSSPWTTRSTRPWRPSTAWRPAESSSSASPRTRSCSSTSGCSRSLGIWRPWLTWRATRRRRDVWTSTINPGSRSLSAGNVLQQVEIMHFFTIFCLDISMGKFSRRERNWIKVLEWKVKSCTVKKSENVLKSFYGIWDHVFICEKQMIMNWVKCSILHRKSVCIYVWDLV